MLTVALYRTVHNMVLNRGGYRKLKQTPPKCWFSSLGSHRVRPLTLTQPQHLRADGQPINPRQQLFLRDRI